MERSSCLPCAVTCRYKLLRTAEENENIGSKMRKAQDNGLGKALESGILSDGFLQARVPQGKTQRPITIQPSIPGSRLLQTSQEDYLVDFNSLMPQSRPTQALSMAHGRDDALETREGPNHAIIHPGRSNATYLQNDSRVSAANADASSKWARRVGDRAVTDSRNAAAAKNDNIKHSTPFLVPQEGNANARATLDEKKEREPEMNGFQTAKSGYIKMLEKEGKKASFSVSNSRPNSKFVPPYVKKALDDMNKNNQAGNQEVKKHNKRTTDNTGSDEGPLSLRTYDLLQLSPGDPLPDELAKLDPMMIEQVCNEVIDSGASISWDDIAGQDAAKRLIQEVVVWPMMNPDIFKGARAPPKGILLFGPPGTGKTLLGKAIASNIDASFFSISASSLTSKWIGEGEKMVKALFAVAGWISPSVIFIDEIDSLLSARKAEGEHESSRRLKTEILVQMEGCDPASSSRKVLLVGATNRPEELDEAARRRMPKQMYIPLPCSKAREEMILRVLGPKGTISSSLTDAEIQKIVEKTQGYSGYDNWLLHHMFPSSYHACKTQFNSDMFADQT